MELFQLLLERGASETEMQAFFEEHPAILMEARAGIPISHSPNFARPKNNKPDFAFSPILGPEVESRLELLELKGPTERILNRGDHRGFAAIDLLRIALKEKSIRDRPPSAGPGPQSCVRSSI